MKEEKIIESKFKDNIEVFVNQIQSLHTTLPFVSSMLKSTGQKADKLLHEFLETKCEKVKEEEKQLYLISPDHAFRHRTLKKNATQNRLAYSIIRKNFVVSLISQFDAYLGALIRAMFISKPDMLNSSEKNLTFSKLLEFSDLAEAREYIIEKEVEAVLRESHASQIKWLENKLGITLTKDLPSWSRFIEVTERRNLFVHCNGVVSSQYINICTQHGHKLGEEIKIGKTLGVTEDYFKKAYETVYEIGFKLGQVMWRKLLIEEIEKADLNMLNATFELIQDHEYDLAIVMLEFATGIIKKHSSEDIKLRMLLNLAQCHKWKQNEEKCHKIVKGIDWSAYSNTFKIASSVLLNDFESASSIMKHIGAQDKDVSKTSYRDWPIFKDFRKSEKFLNTYKEIFNEDFVVTEEAS